MEQLISAADFRNLSAQLNYQLSGDPVLWPALLGLMLDGEIEPADEKFLLAGLKCLEILYGGHRRRLGPFAVLHPIRTAALLATASETSPPADQLFITLFHDKYEDLTPDKVGEELWQTGESCYREVAAGLTAARGVDLNRLVLTMARSDEENYCGYIGRLLDGAKDYRGLVALKLADRLDNTFDLTMEPSRLTADRNCYQTIFETLFSIKPPPSLATRRRHPSERKINGAMRLYQLYKNTLLLSLLRSEQTELDLPSGRLFTALARASINEAQSVLLHIFSFHLKDSDDQQKMIFEVMQFCEKGGIKQISTRTGHRLDHLFASYFNFKGSERNEKLAQLYENKKFMGETALAFLAIFSNFINDPEFRIHGISAHGITPTES